MRRKRAADCMGFGHDASEPCFTVSTLGNIKIRHLGESESFNSWPFSSVRDSPWIQQIEPTISDPVTCTSVGNIK